MNDQLDLESFLQQSKLLSLLSEAGQRRLWESAEEVVFAPGDTLMREGEPGDAFFVITAGVVHILIDDMGAPKQVARLGRGAFLGEMAALMNEPRSATVVARDQVVCLRFDAALVADVLNDTPKVRAALVKLALKRSEDNLQSLMDDSDTDTDTDTDQG